jgi:predicted nucleotidyltransferase
MVAMSQVEALSQQIAEQFHPERIILFGSYGDGQPNLDSDLSLD